MGERGLLVIFGAVAVGLLLVVLGWAAVVRGRIHGQLTGRGRRLHMAVSAVRPDAEWRSGDDRCTGLDLAHRVGRRRARAARRGLTGSPGDEAAQRLRVYGPNELQVTAPRVGVAHLRRPVQERADPDPACATVVSGFLGHTLEAVVITVIVLFAVLLGFIQEYRAEPRARSAAADGGARRRACFATARRPSCPRAIWCPATSWCCAPAIACPPTPG